MANLATSLNRSKTAYHKLTKEKVISARTREHKYAAYMEAWRRKVERIGNLNFPEEARKAGLTGELLLDVALNADGTVRDITVLRSSGSKVLDQAATRIVHLVAPYAPFPEGSGKRRRFCTLSEPGGLSAATA
jgi:protein TonB